MKNFCSRSFLLAAILLLGSEFVARQFFSRSLSGRFDYGFNPTAGFQENSDGTINLFKSGGRPFRPQKFGQAPASGLFRIMVFGNSVPFGYRSSGDLQLSDVYSTLVANQLNEAGHPAEGLDLAISGYGALRVQIVLRQALKYHPSLVILHVDEWSNDEWNDLRRREFDGWHPKNWVMKFLVVRRIYEAKMERIYGKWLPPAITEAGAGNREIAQVQRNLYKPTPEDSARWTKNAVNYTRENIAMAEAAGAKVILISQVSKVKNNEGSFTLDDLGFNDHLRTLIGPGVYYLSMEDVMKQQPNWPDLFVDDVHLTRPGHEVMAKAILKIIYDNKLLPNDQGKSGSAK